MAYRWPADTDFSLWELDVLDRNCPACGPRMHLCDHRYRRFHTLDGPVQLICKLNHCPDPACPGHAKTKSPELEIPRALPQMAIGWDVFCGIGHRRCSRPRAIPLIRSELRDDSGIPLSEDAIDQDIRRYQALRAARQQDAERLRQHSASAAESILCSDGLQPEKGHEALYVVRELTRKRVWFAEPLLSATEGEVRRRIHQAQQGAESLGTPVGLWRSDQQEAFVTAIAAGFPDVPHRCWDNHFLRDLAQPVLEADSQAKVPMRKKVRGLRTIEQAVLQRQKTETKEGLTPQTPEATGTANPSPAAVGPAGAGVRDDGVAVRGSLNDDPGGPLHPPGLRRAEALNEVQESIPRNLEVPKGGSLRSNAAGYQETSRRAWTKSRSSKR